MSASFWIRIKTSVSAIKQLVCVHLFITSDLDGLKRRNGPEEVSSSKKAEPQSHTHLLHNHHRPMGVWRCLLAGAHFYVKFAFNKLFWTIRTNSKQTLFWPEFVGNYITSVHSLVLREVYRGLPLCKENIYSLNINLQYLMYSILKCYRIIYCVNVLQYI